MPSQPLPNFLTRSQQQHNDHVKPPLQQRSRSTSSSRRNMNSNISEPIDYQQQLWRSRSRSSTRSRSSNVCNDNEAGEETKQRQLRIQQLREEQRRRRERFDDASAHFQQQQQQHYQQQPSNKDITDIYDRSISRNGSERSGGYINQQHSHHRSQSGSIPPPTSSNSLLLRRRSNSSDNLARRDLSIVLPQATNPHFNGSHTDSRSRSTFKSNNPRQRSQHRSLSRDGNGQRRQQQENQSSKRRSVSQPRQFSPSKDIDAEAIVNAMGYGVGIVRSRTNDSSAMIIKEQRAKLIEQRAKSGRSRSPSPHMMMSRHYQDQEQIRNQGRSTLIRQNSNRSKASSSSRNNVEVALGGTTATKRLHSPHHFIRHISPSQSDNSGRCYSPKLAANKCDTQLLRSAGSDGLFSVTHSIPLSLQPQRCPSHIDRHQNHHIPLATAVIVAKPKHLRNAAETIATASDIISKHNSKNGSRNRSNTKGSADSSSSRSSKHSNATNESDIISKYSNKSTPTTVLYSLPPTASQEEGQHKTIMSTAYENQQTKQMQHRSLTPTTPVPLVVDIVQTPPINTPSNSCSHLLPPPPPRFLNHEEQRTKLLDEDQKKEKCEAINKVGSSGKESTHSNNSAGSGKNRSKILVQQKKKYKTEQERQTLHQRLKEASLQAQKAQSQRDHSRMASAAVLGDIPDLSSKTDNLFGSCDDDYYYYSALSNANTTMSTCKTNDSKVIKSNTTSTSSNGVRRRSPKNSKLSNDDRGGKNEQFCTSQKENHFGVASECHSNNNMTPKVGNINRALTPPPTEDQTLEKYKHPEAQNSATIKASNSMVSSVSSSSASLASYYSRSSRYSHKSSKTRVSMGMPMPHIDDELTNFDYGGIPSAPSLTEMSENMAFHEENMAFHEENMEAFSPRNSGFTSGTSCMSPSSQSQAHSALWTPRSASSSHAGAPVTPCWTPRSWKHQFLDIFSPANSRRVNPDTPGGPLSPDSKKGEEFFHTPRTSNGSLFPIRTSTGYNSVQTTGLTDRELLWKNHEWNNQQQGGDDINPDGDTLTPRSNANVNSTTANGEERLRLLAARLSSQWRREDLVVPALARRLRDFQFAQAKRRRKYGDERPWGILGLYDYLKGIRIDVDWAEDAATRRATREPYKSWIEYDEEKTRRTGLNQPFFTYFILLACTILLFMSIKSNDWTLEPLSVNPMIGPSATTLVKLGAKESYLIVMETELLRLVTPMFLHAGIIHYLFNMMALWCIGIAVEQSHGFIAAAIIFVLPAIGGTILSALFLPQFISVGASGGIFGLIGACIADIVLNWTLLFSDFVSDGSTKHQRQHMRVILILILDIVVNCLLGLTPFVDNFTHVGGMIYGFLSGIGFMEGISQDFFGVKVTRKSRIKSVATRFFGLIMSVMGILLTLLILMEGDGKTSPCSMCRYASCVPFPFWVEPNDQWWHCDDCGGISADARLDTDTGEFNQITLNCPDGSVLSVDLLGKEQTKDATDLEDRLAGYCRSHCTSTYV